ncbi:MAG: LPS export ABC transporter ATP-binding protein, partial [Deltaproteobacteria bacterium]|nr:LPS export ABC transporter ATP-binding protein [Deltaproteobacteria bacterium]
MTTKPHLETRHLSKSFRGRQVVSGVSLCVNGGEVVGLLGPNGSGKTTTFKMILGLEQPERGEVILNGQPLAGLPLYRRARLGLGYLPQTPSVFAGLNVKDNLLGVLLTLKHPNAHQRAAALLAQFGLSHLSTQKGGTLSGGERRKLEFARALCSNPAILLVDEPFAAVDPVAQEELAGLIRLLAQDGIGVLLTDHSVRQSLAACERIYLIVNGEIVESGPS